MSYPEEKGWVFNPFISTAAGIFVVAKANPSKAIIQKVCSGVAQAIARNHSKSLIPAWWEECVGNIPGQSTVSSENESFTLSGGKLREFDAESLAIKCCQQGDNTAIALAAGLLTPLSSVTDLCALVFGEGAAGQTSLVLTFVSIVSGTTETLPNATTKFQLQKTTSILNTGNKATRSELNATFENFTPMGASSFYATL